MAPVLNRSDELTDLEATRLCAEAEGKEVRGNLVSRDHGVMLSSGVIYDPLHDDAQCMALVKRFRVWITTYKDEGWLAQVGGKALKDANLNRAVVFAVAKMWAAKVAAIRDRGAMA